MADVQRKIADGYVNPGWTPADWAARLRQMAERCEAIHPELAADYRARADAVERRNPPPMPSAITEADLHGRSR